LQDVVHSSIAAAGDNRVKAVADRHPYLSSSVRCGTGRLGFNLYASSPEHCRRAVNILRPVFTPSA